MQPASRSAASPIAIGAIIRARPIVPALVSSLVLIFAVVEVPMLPFLPAMGALN
ncbi:MAG: hypothetical protein WA728_22825 [Xanthobacteraceae bacterium]